MKEYIEIYLLALKTITKIFEIILEQGLLHHMEDVTRCKLFRQLGRCPVGLGTSSRILRGSPVVFVLSRNFTVTLHTLWIFLGQFVRFSTFWGLFWSFFGQF